MLRLTEQIGRADLAVDRVVGDDERLGRTREEVDADSAEELTFGLGDKGVAGPDQHIDRRDRFGAERHRGDSLDAAKNIDLVGARPCAMAATMAARARRGKAASQAMTRFTPATFAVTTLICAEATKGYLPPGT